MSIRYIEELGKINVTKISCRRNIVTPINTSFYRSFWVRLDTILYHANCISGETVQHNTAGRFREDLHILLSGYVEKNIKEKLIKPLSLHPLNDTSEETLI